MRGMIFVLLFSLTLNLYAHENCTEDLSCSYGLYDTTMTHIENKSNKDARYYAKRFQHEAYEFSSICKEKYFEDAKIHTYKRIIKDLRMKEKALFQKGILTEKVLSK